MLGRLLAMPIRILNVPVRTVEKLVDREGEVHTQDLVLSRPLEELAEAVEEAADGPKPKG